ncbi:Gfo/Idh/MocA family protein [Haladaptatus sp. NG-SE-30]
MNTLDIGFVGGGTVAGWHAETVTSLGHDIAAITDIDPDVRAAFAETYDVATQYKDHEQMIANEDLDVVVVAVPNVYHADCAVAALEADVDVFVEKPLAHDLAAAERVEAAEQESDGTVMVGFMRPFAPHATSVKEMIDDGEFGDVYEINLDYVRRRGIPGYGSWFASKSTAGGGALIDIGVHVLHLGLHLLDFPKIESVTASTGAHFGTKEDYTATHAPNVDLGDPEEFDVEDNARAFIRTADGTTINLKCAWASNSEVSREVQVLGDESGAEFSIMGGDLTLRSTNRNGVSDETVAFPPLEGRDLSFGNGETFTAEWQYFTEVVAGEREHTRSTLEEGVTVQRVIEAIYESADVGSEIELTDLR